MQKYTPGQKVKIISLEKVRSYPKDADGDYVINGNLPFMENLHGRFADKEVTVEGFTQSGNFYIEEDIGIFSPEMISGPTDTPPDNYAEKLERFVLAAMAGNPGGEWSSPEVYADVIMGYAKSTLAAFDEEIKKHRI